VSSGALYHWRRDIEADVRLVMRAEGLTDLSIAACKRWVRAFILAQVSCWTPEARLAWHEVQRVSAAFEDRLTAAKRKLRVR
jgi:hypothetical protein